VETRLLPVNGLLSLVTSGDVNPAPLAEAGFRVAGLEIPALLHGHKVVIDILLFHEATNHLVLCESKSGANIEDAQARTYSVLPPTAAVQAACVTIKSRTPPTSETLYVCLEDYAERIRRGLKNAGVSFPVLAVGHKSIRLLDSALATETLSGPLAQEITLTGPPPRLLPFDPDSPIEVIERYVRSEMVALLSRRTEHITITSLTESVARHYGLYAHKAQQTLKSKVASAVDRISASAPDSFAHDRRTGRRPEGLVRFLKTPESLDPRGRTQAYQALSRSGRPTRSRPPVDPNQLDLLQELEAGDNDEDSPVTTGEEGEA
jgi:hypothetical protein